MAVFTIPKPEPTEVPSSNRHLPISKCTTFSPGTLIPILCKDILPGDKVKINLDSLIESLPMVAPNLNGYKASFDFYFCPWSNYYGWMDNNKRSTVQANLDRERWHYQIDSASSITNTLEEFAEYLAGGSRSLNTMEYGAVQPGSLLDYLGIPPGFMGKVSGAIGEKPNFTPQTFPAEKLISVIDIYRNYYVNNQEEYAYFSYGTDRGTMYFDRSQVFAVPLDYLDQITLLLRQADLADNVVEYLIGYDLPENIYFGNYSISNYGELLQALICSSCRNPLGGLPLRTYRMDLNRGILSSAVGSVASRVQVTDGSFDVDTLRFANKLQKFIDRIDISGGRFSDMMRARWGVTPRNTLNIPDYLGTVSSFFGVTDVISTASGTNDNLPDGRGNSVLGQQAGFAVGKVKRNNAPISFRADQYGTLVCMFSLVPLVTYSQGIEKEDLKLSFLDVFDPAFSQLGYDDVSRQELSVHAPLQLYSPDDITSNTLVVLSQGVDDLPVGKRVAWAEYMSSLPRAHGLFAYGQDFDYWVNNRTYQTSMNQASYSVNEDGREELTQSYLELLRPYGDISFSTYVNPETQNHLFADVGFTAQNFRLRVNFDIVMRRNIGSRIMPHL